MPLASIPSGSTAAREMRLFCVLLALPLGGCGALRCAGFFRGPTAPPAPTALAEEPMALEQVWHVNGNWTTAAVDSEHGHVYAKFDSGVAEGPASDIWRIDARGQLLEKIELRPPYPFGLGSGHRMLLAQFSKGATPMLVLWSHWHPHVTSFDASGRQLWRSHHPAGVDDVAVADLDRDGVDEVIVGLNGGGGVEVLNESGLVRWRSTVVGNVWSVATVPATDGHSMEVVTLGSRTHTVANFSADGCLLRNLGPRQTITEPYRLEQATLGRNRRVLVYADLSRPLSITALDVDHGEIWSIVDELAGASGITDLSAASDAPFAAIAMRDGGLIVYSVRDGRRLASMWTACAYPYQHPIWLPGTDGTSPLLVVHSGRGMKAVKLVAKPDLRSDESMETGAGEHPPTESPAPPGPPASRATPASPGSTSRRG
jgi:hypothetical protein